MSREHAKRNQKCKRDAHTKYLCYSCLMIIMSTTRKIIGILLKNLGFNVISVARTPMQMKVFVCQWTYNDAPIDQDTFGRRLR